MKKLLLQFSFLFVTLTLSAQCSEIFFSEYVEGYSNNKALEIYNPTDAPVNLSNYSIARYSNGSTSVDNTTIIQLPNEMLASDDVFVLVVDLTDVDDWDSQFDKPAWNGYNLIDTIFDEVTGNPVLDADGNVLLGPQYNEDGAAIFGTEYNEEYDLQCKADAFLCPTYEINNTMYFNGNDAMVLLEGTEVNQTGSNIIDVIGVIGEDPDVTLMQPAWVSPDGFWLTRDRTLVRKSSIAGGRNEINDIVYSSGGTFEGKEWWSYRKNSFEFLGIHESVCGSKTDNAFSCISGPFTSMQNPFSSTRNINLIEFNMYPNPNNIGVLNIEADERIDQVQLYSMMGQQVRSQLNIDGGSEMAFSLSDVSKGMYIVKIAFADDQYSIQKLIVE